MAICVGSAAIGLSSGWICRLVGHAMDEGYCRRECKPMFRAACCKLLRRRRDEYFCVERSRGDSIDRVVDVALVAIDQGV